jgi:hypothetical protein
MGGVHDRVRGDLEAVLGIAAGVVDQVARGREAAQFADQLGPFRR